MNDPVTAWACELVEHCRNDGVDAMSVTVGSAMSDPLIPNSSGEEYVLGAPEHVSPDDPLINGPRWRAERDELAHLIFTYGDRIPGDDLAKVWDSIVLPIVVADDLSTNYPAGEA